MTWITEFGEAYDIPPDVENRLHELGFEDESWHNDTAPIFRKAIGESGEWLVVCEHPDIDRREFSDAKRFTVSAYPTGFDGLECDVKIETDSIEELLRFMEHDFTREVKR